MVVEAAFVLKSVRAVLEAKVERWSHMHLDSSFFLPCLKITTCRTEHIDQKSLEVSKSTT